MTNFSEQFALARERLPGNAAVDAERINAFDGFMRHGLPTRKHENWRYTDLRAIRDTEIELVTAAQAPDEAAIARYIERAALHIDAVSVVLANGALMASLSKLDGDPAYELMPLGADLGVLSKALEKGRRVDAHPLAQLNTAFTSDGLLIDVSTRASAPLLVTVVAPPGSAVASQPRIVLQLDAGAELELILHFIDSEAGGGWTNVVVQIDQGAGSKLGLYQLQEHSEQHFHTGLVYADLAASAALKAGFIDIGSRLARNDVDIKLRERGASAELFGAFLPMEGQHIDDHICVHHAAVETASRQNFRGIIGAKSRGVFNGKVVVHEDAQRVDATQRSDNLLLDESAEIDTKPELEIHADDVKCSHGATVGEIDEQHLFYLRSRGIDASSARALLTFAFANSVLQDIELPALRDAIADRIAARLPQHEHWEELA